MYYRAHITHPMAMTTIPISIPLPPCPPPACFTLLVQDRPILCSRRVIASSSLFMDMCELVEDYSPIPIPAFISRQIMLDLVEMVEKGDWECAHLILVSLSYLLDFLIAVDFLGCERLKAVIEEKVKDKLSDSNWKDVLDYTKNILGLDNTVKQTMDFICTRLVEIAGEKDSLSIVSDPFQEEYEQFTPDLVKIIMKSECLGGSLKFCILKKWKWVRQNLEDEDLMFQMLLTIQFKDLDDSRMDEIVRVVKDWDISDDNWEVFKEVIANSKKERELECLMRKQLAKTKKLNRHEHFLNHDMFFGIPGDPELLFEL